MRTTTSSRAIPRSSVTAIVKIAQSDHPPLRYAAGSDAVRMTQEALEKRLAELAQWKELSVSTDSDDAQATSNEEAKS